MYTSVDVRDRRSLLPRTEPAPATAGAQRRTVANSQPPALVAARFGLTGVAPFIASPDVHAVNLLGGGGAAGFVRRRRWAVTPGDVVAPATLREAALDEYLDHLYERRLKPLFLAAGDPEPYLRRGLDVSEIADEAVIDLPDFSLKGSARANLRHSVSSARRHGLTLVPYHHDQAHQLAEISQEWLRTKRGGEMGFTLSRYADVERQVSDGATDLWSVVDDEGTVQAWCTWRHYLGGRARVIDVMRRRVAAPNPSMDFLIASTLERYRDLGLEVASLASVPRSHGETSERVYPTKPLRAYKQKYAPRWEPRWLAVPHARQRLSAMLAISSAYCPGGLRRALRRNG